MIMEPKCTAAWLIACWTYEFTLVCTLYIQRYFQAFACMYISIYMQVTCVHINVCTSVCMHCCMYVLLYACTTLMCVHLHTCNLLCMVTCPYVYTCIPLCKYIWMFACLYVHMCMCAHLRVCVQLYVTFTHAIVSSSLFNNKLHDGRIAQWQNACPRAKKSAVQASATASCCGGELFTNIQHLLYILASCC